MLVKGTSKSVRKRSVRFQPFEEIIIDHLRKNAAECTRLTQEFRTSAHKSFFSEMAEWRVGLAQHEKTQDK